MPYVNGCHGEVPCLYEKDMSCLSSPSEKPKLPAGSRSSDPAILTTEWLFRTNTCDDPSLYGSDGSGESDNLCGSPVDVPKKCAARKGLPDHGTPMYQRVLKTLKATRP